MPLVLAGGSIVLYCIALYCIVLYCIILYAVPLVLAGGSIVLSVGAVSSDVYHLDQAN